MSNPPPRPTRWVIVDDADVNLINYRPGDAWYSLDGVKSVFAWNSTVGVLNSKGPVFYGTQHGTRVGGSISFSYSGSDMEVRGTVEHSDRKTDGRLPWNCHIDGREFEYSIGNFTAIPADNNIILCYDYVTAGSGVGPHTLTMNITASEDVPFWIDSIAYVPSSDVSLENKTIILDVNHPSVLGAMSSGWDAAWQQAVIVGSTFQYEFIGTSLSWWGVARLRDYDPPTSPLSIGTFAVDGGSPQPVYFPTVPSRGNWERQWFETGSLPMGKHKITVEYSGDGKYPLGLTQLRIKNGTMSAFYIPPSNSTTSKSTTSKTTTAILASVVPVAVIIIGVLIYLIWRRRRSAQAEKASDPPFLHSAYESTDFPVVSPYVAETFDSSRMTNTQPLIDMSSMPAQTHGTGLVADRGWLNSPGNQAISPHQGSGKAQIRMSNIQPPTYTP